MIRVDVNLVMVDATVKTKAGQIMANLKKEDFELREDGVPQKIDIFSRDELPLSVALVLDLSDSIGPFLGPLREAANTALSALKPEDEVALFTFSTEAELRVPFTKDKSLLAQQINAFKVGGATNINDGIFVAAQYLLNAPQKGRKVIILISDDVGTDAGGQGTRDIVTETIAADSVLYNLKIPGYNPPGTLFYAGMVQGLVNIHKVVEQTGERFLTFPMWRTWIPCFARSSIASRHATPWGITRRRTARTASRINWMCDSRRHLGKRGAITWSLPKAATTFIKRGSSRTHGPVKMRSEP